MQLRARKNDVHGGWGGGATIYSEDVFGIALSDSTALSTWLYGGLPGGMYPFTFCRVQTERGYWQSTRLAGTGERNVGN